MKKLLLFCPLFCIMGLLKAQTDSVTLHINIKVDYFGGESHIKLFAGTQENCCPIHIWEGFPNNQQGWTSPDSVITLPEGCYFLVITDQHSDGFGFTHGHIIVTWMGSILVSLVDNFPSPSTASFCLYNDEEIFGCTDPNALNYNSEATIDDESCEYAPVLGCMDPIAENYDSTATIDDGSCQYVYGCTDFIATNYDSTATIDDGSCEYVYGCMFQSACNYDSTATINIDCDFVSCHVYGCVDPDALNFNPLATDPDFSNPPYWGCEYWIPTNIIVEQYCNEFIFTATDANQTEMPATADIYNWTIGSDAVDMVGTTIPYTITEDGTYTVVFYYGQGIILASVQLNVIVSMIPYATLTQVGDTLFCDAPNAELYLWNGSGQPIVTSVPWFVPTQPGDYSCNASNNFECTVVTNTIQYSLPCCPADYDCNGSIGVSDLIIFISYYGCQANCDTNNDGFTDGDLNSDGICNVTDLMMFIGKYGTLCP